MTARPQVLVGFAYGAMPALVMGAVPPSETASANSFNTLMRSIGSSVSAAVIGVVPAQLTTDFGGYALPSEGAFRAAVAIGCGVALTAAAVASLIPVRVTAERSGIAAAPSPASATEVPETKA